MYTTPLRIINITLKMSGKNDREKKIYFTKYSFSCKYCFAHAVIKENRNDIFYVEF